MGDLPFGYIVPSFFKREDLPSQSGKLLSLAGTLIKRHLKAFRVTPLISLNSPLSRARGWMITANLPYQDLTSEKAITFLAKKTLKACLLAVKKGACIAGLGFDSFNAGVIGAVVARRLPIALTSGLSYSLAASLEGCIHVLEQKGLDLAQTEVVVLGAAGSAGGILAQLLAREGAKYITLVECGKQSLDKLARLIVHESGVPCKITVQARKAIRRADLLIAAPGETIEPVWPGDLKPGALVCDLGWPYFFSVNASRSRTDVLFFNGGVVRIPDPAFKFAVGNLPPGVIPPTFAEVVILALERRFENYSSGSALRAGKVEEMRRLGCKHGFRLAGVHYRGRILGNVAKPVRAGPLVTA
jgi:fatty aldehyde-generating acyl-ACP reductase